MEALKQIYWLRLILGIIAAIICVSYTIVTGSVSINLVLNSSVEIGETTPQHWTSVGNGVEWSLDEAKTGTKSLRINVNNDTAEWKSKTRQIKEETTYYLSAFFKGIIEKNNTFFLAIKFFSDEEATNQIGESSFPIRADNYSDWTFISKDFVTPKAVKSCIIFFKAINATGDLYGDNFEIREPESISLISPKLLNGISIAIIFYIISYYIIKFKYMHKVEKRGKLYTMGIGIYFISWLVFWILFYTIAQSLL